MASPLGNRKDGKFMAVSTAPSINKTPMGASTPPVPYPVCHDLSNSVGVVPHVKFNGDPAYVLDQTTQPDCTGDAAGSAGGIRSGTVSGEVKPTSASRHVKIAGKRVVRVGDTCTLNNGNCPGVYIAGPATAPPGADPNPPIVPETPQEKSFTQKLGIWWEGTKKEVTEALAHPVEGAKGAVKDTINIVPQLGTLLMQGGALQGAGEMQQAAAIQSTLGNNEIANQLSSTAEGVRESAHGLELPQFELNNPAQQGGAKIAMAAQLATGVAGLAKGAAKVGAKQLVKMGAKEAGALEKAAVKEGAALAKEGQAAAKAATALQKGAEEAATAGKVGKTGDGFHVKGYIPGDFRGTVQYLKEQGVPKNIRRDILEGFEWKDVRVERLPVDTVVYRYSGDASRPGRWYTASPQSDPRRALSLPPENPASALRTITLEKGTTVIRGTVAPRYAQPGGAEQLFLINAQ